MPALEDMLNVLLLRDYNTRLVVICTLLLGGACGMMGGFLLLRKRSLMGDTLSHATLPGIAMAFLMATWMGFDGKSLPLLLFGATVAGLIGCMTVLFIRNNSRIKDDAAMGIVLSVYFGLGVALLGMVQDLPEGSAAGLSSFIYGKTASMVMADFQLLGIVTALVLALSILLFKEFRLLCFDENYAVAQGWSVRILDTILLALVTAITVAGLQAVGLILIIAFLITPAAAARFWTERLDWMLGLATAIGAISGWIGASVSAFFPRMPAGAVIVLVAAGIFLLSMILGSRRGVLVRWWQQHSLRLRMRRQHLLRALYEILEARAIEDGKPPAELEIHPVAFRQIRGRRSWSDLQLRSAVRRAYRAGLVHVDPHTDTLTLTPTGLKEAAVMTRNHRLWEIYLIEYADIATSRVDRDADAVEHILGEDLVRGLEAKLQTYQRPDGALVPASPHPIRPGD